MMKKKKQSRSQSSMKKNLEPSPDSSPSPSPRLLAMFRSKLASGKDLKHMLIRGMRSKTIPGLSSQSRIVRCPKCQKLLQEPLDATSYKCGGCDSILHAKRLEPEGNDKTIPLALISSESAENGSKTPKRNTHREYNPRASPSVERDYHSEAVYKHETSDIRREWMRRADDFSATGDSDVFDSARSSPYNSRSNASEWTTQHEGGYEDPPRGPSPSSAYEYGYSSSPFHGSQVSASEQSYYHHQPNQYKQYGREGWFQEPSVAPPRFQGETSHGKYHHWPSQSQLNDLQYHDLYESATPHRSVYSERIYQAAAEPHRSTYSERSMGVSTSEASSEKSSLRNKKKYVRERNHVVKRYVLPSAGGAPFVTCSYCLELLELPRVSLHGKHKRYQVRCGSCSGVLKFPIGEKAATVLNSPGLADETIHQDSASEGHEEIYPDDRICKSTNDVILSRSLEALQPQLKPLVNHWLREQQPASSTTMGESSRNHLEQSEETHSEKSAEMDNNIFERVSCDLEESGYEKNEIIKPKEIFGEVPLYKKERMSASSIEAETVPEPLNKHKYVCEISVVSENTRGSQELDLEETQENEERGGESTWEEITRDKPGLQLEKSLCISDSISDSSSSSNGETFENTAVKETEHISSTFSATPESPLKSLMNEKQMFIGHPDQSGEATVAISRIHEEQSKYENEASSEGQELHKTNSDRVRYESEEESRYETNETLEPGKVGEDGSVFSHGNALKSIIEGETGEERSVSHQMDPQDEIVAKSYGTAEPVYLEGSGYAGERTWAETVGDRAGLHLEEYESNYENHYSKPLEWTSRRALTFRLHENELGTTPDPEEDANGRSISTDSFSDHESSKGIAVSHEKPRLLDENKIEAVKVGVMAEDRPSLHLEKCENESMKLEEPFEWTSERAPTFRMHEYEPGTILEPDEDANERSESISKGSFNNNESSKVRAVLHEEEPQLVNDNRTEALVENGPLLQLKKWENGSRKLEETFEWTSGRALTFRLQEYEPGTMFEPDKDDDGRSEHSSRVSFNDHGSSKVAEDGPSLHLEKVDNETVESDEALEPKDDRFRHCPDDTLEQETMMFHFEMSQDKQENISASGSRISSEDNESPSEMAEVDSEAEEEILEDHFSKKNEKTGLTSEPYAHIYSTTEASEMVGLRHALYQTQSSPLRSPLTSPIHTPIGSPLHYLMGSPMHSHIVSPLRSPINSSGSLSDVLFFGKKSC